MTPVEVRTHDRVDQRDSHPHLRRHNPALHYLSYGQIKRRTRVTPGTAELTLIPLLWASQGLSILPSRGIGRESSAGLPPAGRVLGALRALPNALALPQLAPIGGLLRQSEAGFAPALTPLCIAAPLLLGYSDNLTSAT